MRYARLYLHFLRFSFSRALEFRVDFFFRVIMDFVFYAVSLAFFQILYAQTPLLGGWNLDQIYLFVCSYLWVDAVFMTVLSNNLWWLPIFINRGDLDYYLTRPVSTLFFLSLRDFAANSFLNVIIASSLLSWAILRYPGTLGLGRVLTFLAFLLLGTYFLYLTRLLCILPVFWVHSSHGLLEVSWALTHLGERPVAIYRPWLRLALLTVLPLGFIASVPAAVLLEGPSAGRVLHASGLALALSMVTLWLWKRGLAAYSSASA